MNGINQSNHHHQGELQACLWVIHPHQEKGESERREKVRTHETGDPKAKDSSRRRNRERHHHHPCRTSTSNSGTCNYIPLHYHCTTVLHPSIYGSSNNTSLIALALTDICRYHHHRRERHGNHKTVFLRRTSNSRRTHLLRIGTGTKRIERLLVRLGTGKRS